MPDEKVVNQPGATEAPATTGGPQGEQGSESTTTGTGEQGGAEKTKPGEGGAGSESAASAEELVLEGAEQLEDGTFQLKVGSSTYKGKTTGELVKNALAGIAEKDSYITQLRADKATRVPEKFGNRNALKGQPEGSSAIELPNEQTVYREELQLALASAHGLDPKMLSWSEADWDAYSEQDGVKSWRISELRQQVREVLRTAKANTNVRMDEASTVSINSEILDTETAKVKDLLAKSELSEDALGKFDYEAVLDRAMTKRGKGGILESGAIVHEASIEIQKMLNDERKSPAARKLEESILSGKKKVVAIPATRGGSGGPKDQPKEHKPTGDYDRAAEAALADFIAGKK